MTGKRRHPIKAATDTTSPPALRLTVPALLVAVPAELRALPADARVEWVTTHAGHSTIGHTPAGKLIEQLQGIIDRQNRGLYTLDEAAQAIADHEPGIPAEELLADLAKAHQSGNLKVRDPGTLFPRSQSERIRTWDVVTPQDIDQTLEGLGVQYRFPNRGAAATQTPQHQYRRAVQEQSILSALQALGYNPLSLPPYTRGKASAPRSAARESLGYSDSVMKKAWEALLADGRIKYAAN